MLCIQFWSFNETFAPNKLAWEISSLLFLPIFLKRLIFKLLFAIAASPNNKKPYIAMLAYSNQTTIKLHQYKYELKTTLWYAIEVKFSYNTCFLNLISVFVIVLKLLFNVSGIVVCTE